jgi:hypothetical protein
MNVYELLRVLALAWLCDSRITLPMRTEYREYWYLHSLQVRIAEYLRWDPTSPVSADLEV